VYLDYFAVAQAQPLAQRQVGLHAHVSPHVQRSVAAPAQPHADFAQRHSF
jgi:hypothetical protein